VASFAPDERCATCGAPRGRAYEYCLECGTRFHRVRRRVHWVWPALAALLLAAAGGAVAATTSAGGGARSMRTIVATQPLVAASPPAPRPRSSAKPKAKTRSGLITWPGRPGYTVVLATIPVRTGPAAAHSQALAAVQAGVRDVGVLVSSSYSGLHPGYFVVFSGVYDTLEEAQSALVSIRPVFPGAFAQQIAA
jgi:hypothetical protein